MAPSGDTEGEAGGKFGMECELVVGAGVIPRVQGYFDIVAPSVQFTCEGNRPLCWLGRDGLISLTSALLVGFLHSTGNLER